MKKALITGITGQDGSYLAELLLGLGYEVHGIVRRSSSISTSRLDHLYENPQESKRRLHLHFGDITDFASTSLLVQSIRPDEIYNLAAQSHVKVSFETPVYTSAATGLGNISLLEAVRQVCPEARFYQASSSEMYGNSAAPQNELSPMIPASPYASAKLFAHHNTRIYREGFGLYASNGVLFNHESPRRGETFVTRKIVKGLARIEAGLQKSLYLGNLDARRDWGYAPDYVVGMWMMLQRDEPDDFVLSTGKAHSVRDFIDACLELTGLKGEVIKFDPRYERPIEVDYLQGDSSKARAKLGWKSDVGLEDLVKKMLTFERESLKNTIVDIPSSTLWNSVMK